MDKWILNLGASIDAIVANYVLHSVQILAAALAPIVIVALSIWWFFLGWSVIRGELQAPLSEIAFRMFKVTFFIALALNAALYVENISGVADGLRDGMATVFGVSRTTLAGVAQDTTIQPAGGTVWSVINDFDLSSGTYFVRIVEDGGFFNISSWIAAILFAIGQSALILTALFIAIMTKVFQAFFLAVGPLFILCAAFKPTQKFFDNWLSSVLSTIVLCWIGLFILGFATFTAKDFLSTANGKFENINYVAFALKYLCMCVLFAVLLLNAQGWAAQLTGGAATQLGLGAASRLAGTAGLLLGNGRGAGGGGGGFPELPSPASAGPSRLNRAATAVGYAAGRGVVLANRGAAVAGRYTMSAARGAVAISQQAMYKIAAMRGRR